MELKSYQKKVIADLTRYLELLNETKSDAAAFRLFWQEKSAPTLGLYQNVIPGVPNLCFKVPTGGGKTFIACNAVRPIFDALPATKTKAVVWLVPSDAILTQTAKSLKNPQHPYRQKIDVDFGGIQHGLLIVCGSSYGTGIDTELVNLPTRSIRQ